MLNGKKILLGITGSIASVKCYDLVKQLMAKGASVRVVLTSSAKNFISPIALKTFINDEVYGNENLFDENDPMLHIKLARFADIILIAPATANFIAKITHGFADDLLSSICIASDAKVVIVPAMNTQMWSNKFVQKNVSALVKSDITVVGPAIGTQACGQYGVGRMCEPAHILLELNKLFIPQILKGKKILITAGSTLEKIDPVRYISNFSSGKTGYALANAAAAQGAEVILISGQSTLKVEKNVSLIPIISTNDMYEKVMEFINEVDIFISSAAVADYMVGKISPKKYKKGGKALVLELTPTIDIISCVANLSKKPFVVGFAAETENLLINAQKKLSHKKLDMIIANDVSDDKIFGKNMTEVYILTPNKKEPIFLKEDTKYNIANKILKLIAKSIAI